MRRLLLSMIVILAAAGAASAQSDQKPGRASAIFAAGCFWCVEADFDKVPGVLETISGYTGGRTPNPTYKQVSGGSTGHTEAVEIVYDPRKVTYPQLLEHFWRNVDPTVKDRQFCDVGEEYRSAIFVRNDTERKQAEESKKKIAAQLGVTIYTEITDAATFYRAEEYHQDYYKKNPVQYKYYRWNCGRDRRLEQLWGPRKGDS